MKISVLTTDTSHHAYFVRCLAAEFPEIQAFCEDLPSKSAGASACEFEIQRDEWEQELWFSGKKTPIASLIPTQSFVSMNDSEAVSRLRASHPEVIIVFGTGVLRAEVLEVQPRKTLNLHGGDPEEYRGLDTHLWAIYEEKFSALVTTLHRVDKGIDTGEIVERTALRLKKSMELFQLRALNTEACVEMTLKALRRIRANGDVDSAVPRKKGRYYSEMPQEIKFRCPALFRKHTALLSP